MMTVRDSAEVVAAKAAEIRAKADAAGQVRTK